MTDAELLDYIERTPELKVLQQTARHFIAYLVNGEPYLNPHARDLARAFHAHEQRIRSECVPPGYRLVPEELFRQLKHYTESHRLCFPDCGAPTEEEVTAMLSAAPQPTAGAVPSPEALERVADLKITLDIPDRYACEVTQRICADQWSRICQILEEPAPADSGRAG